MNDLLNKKIAARRLSNVTEVKEISFRASNSSILKKLETSLTVRHTRILFDRMEGENQMLRNFDALIFYSRMRNINH